MSFGRQTGTAGGVEPDAVADFARGVEFLKNGYPQKALECLKRAVECDPRNSYYLSFFGLSMARAERKWAKAAEPCEQAIQIKRNEIQFHLNLADVYVAAGRREDALDTIDRALKSLGEDKRLRIARNRAENRRTPVLAFLGRENSLNRELGRLRHRILGSRTK
jgi:tetratricopeptide (TPR) repeat protein